MNGPTIDDIRSWPAAADVPPACAALGISKSYGYELIKRGEFPVKTLKVGRKTRVLTADLMRVLGIAPDEREAEPDAGEGAAELGLLRAIGGTGAA